VDPYGHIEVHPASQLEYNLRWPGHYYDPETALHYNRYRYYDPALGRYLQTDPLGYEGSPTNLYGYPANPLTDVDVLGLTGHPTHQQHANDGSAPQHNSGHEGADGGQPHPQPHPHVEDPANPSPARRAELDSAQQKVARAQEIVADQPRSRQSKTVAVNGGDHISGYDTESRGTPAGFETAGRDPSTNLAYEQQIGHQSPANSSVDPRRTTDGGVVGAMGTGETIPGGAAATHAERQSVIAQNAQGTNEPIGVSREQCGDCRREFRQHAQNPDRPGYPSPVVVGDPGHTRVYNSDGSVDVYRPDGSHVGTVPAGQSPAATISNYEGIPW
jgi:RHS repeat-associated protein